MKKLILTLLAGTFVSIVSAQTQPTLIVAPFQGGGGVASWQPAMGEGLSEMLVTEIGKLNKFQVLENSQLGELKNEINEGQDGWIDQAQKVDKGGFAAADFMFTAKVTSFGNKETHLGLGGFVPGSLGTLGLKQTTANVRIDWRLVDVATRKIIKTGSAAQDHKGVGFDVGVGVNGRGGGISLDNKEFMDSALGKATVEALGQITSVLNETTLPASGRVQQKEKAAASQSSAASAIKHQPGKVLAFAGKDKIILSVGTQQGFKEGDKVDLYQVTDVKDDKGAVVYSDEKLIGELTLVSVQGDKSCASYNGDAVIQQGYVVKAK